MHTQADTVVAIAAWLRREMAALSWHTPSHVYNPLTYMWAAHRQYLERFGGKAGRVLLLGMNPGPWGMAQTGVPFGEINRVRDWLGITAPLAGPLPAQHEKYPVTGFDCRRSEGSGKRFWGWAQARFDTPERFFEHFFVWNYCPLLFIGNNRNLVPEKLRKAEREALLAVCDRALRQLLDATEPSAVFGIGRFAEARLQAVVGPGQAVGYLPHPSPANPAANRNWPAMAEAALGNWS